MEIQASKSLGRNLNSEMKTKPFKVEKSWGYELWLANNEENDYCGKLLHVKAGHRFSMHFHASKHETFYVLKGTAILETIDTNTATVCSEDLREGECYVIDRLVPHQVEAITELDIIESSTYHRDEDSYRVWRK